MPDLATDTERLERYVKSFESKVRANQDTRHLYPTVRQVARGLKWSQARVIEAVEDHGCIELTYYNVNHKVADGDRFVEYFREDA